MQRSDTKLPTETDEPRTGHGNRHPSEPTEQVRRALIAGEYSPGERLVEADLALWHDAPRAAIRTALIALEAEGLVERLPHRGARVRVLSIEEGIEVAETRRELESLCTRHAAERATETQRADLERIIGELRQAADASRLQRYRELSAAFHEVLGQASHHDTAWRLLAQIRSLRLALHFPDAFSAVDLGSSLPDHDEIARAVLARDGDAAANAMSRHVGHVVALLEAHRARGRGNPPG